MTYGAGAKSVIAWESEARDGFLIEASGNSGRNWSPIAITADVRNVITGGLPHFLFRVRAIGPGGLSEPVVATVININIERRRAERP